jgi:hypothetical protein
MSRNRQSSLGGRCRQSWLVYAALAVVFARGPVPWVHSHELMAHDGPSDESFARHLRDFHAAGDVEHGWHIHWTLPWQVFTCPCQHDQAPAQERAVAVEMPLDVAQSAPVHQADPDLHAGAPPLATVDRDTAPRWGPLASCRLHFLETYLPRVTLRALFCVAQC